MPNKNPSHENEAFIESEIASLEKTIEQRGGTVVRMDECHPALHLEFLRMVLAEEDLSKNPQEWEIDLKNEVACRLKPPENLSDLTEEEMTRHLGDLLDLLAQFHLTLCFTDHMDDRELYQYILDKVLINPIVLGPQTEGLLVYHDCCCSIAETENWLSYYAEPWEREDWLPDLDGPLPQTKALKADRTEQLESLAEKYRSEPIPEVHPPHPQSKN